MYTRPYCPFCDRAKRLLRSKGAGWEEVDLDEQPERRAEMVERSGRETVPQIWIDDVHVGGSDELTELDARGELDAVLVR
jgi:glutaredoxin 3